MNHRKYIILIVLSVLVISVVSIKFCADGQPAISRYDAQGMLEKVHISPVTYAPNPSCGIILPSELPIDLFRITVIGTAKENGLQIDLFEGKKLETDSWIVFDELDRYESVMLTMEMVCEEQIIASKVVDLLSVE